MNTIALIGLSGSGKSTVGGRRRPPPGGPPTQTSKRGGKPTSHTQPPTKTPPRRARPGVLSLGGGAPMTAQGADARAGHQGGLLRVDPQQAALRVSRDPDRPLLAGADPVVRLRQLLTQRAPTYARLASLTVDTDQASAAEVVDVIVNHRASSPGRPGPV